MTDQIAPKYTEHLPQHIANTIERQLEQGQVTLRMSAGTVKVTYTNGTTYWYYREQRINRLADGDWKVRMIQQRREHYPGSLKRCKQFVDQCLEEK